MKRILLFIPVFLLVLTVAFVVAFNLGLFHSPIQDFIAKKSGSNVQLGSTTLLPKWPLVLHLGNTVLDNAAYSLRWVGFDIELGSLMPPYAVTLVIDQPKFELKSGFEVKKQPETTAFKGSEGGNAWPLHLSVTMKDGEFSGNEVHLSAVNLNFEQKLLLKSAAKIHAQAFVQSKFLPVQLPFAIDTDALTLTADTIKTSDLKISFGGLLATGTGASLLNEGRHRWNASIEAPDLAKLPKPPMDIPATDWRGSVQMNAEFLKEGAEKPWSVEGDINAKDVSANVKYHRDKLTVQGPFSLALETHFKYAEGAAAVRNLRGNVDLTPTHVVYQDILQKSPGLPLKGSVIAAGDLNALKIEALQLELWKFAGKVSGQTTLKKPFTATLKFDVPLFSLEGADKVLLPLARSPVRGEIAARGSFAGDLTAVSEGHIVLDTFKIKNLSAEVDYDKPGVLKARGPVKISFEGRLEADKLKLILANIRGNANATDASLVAGPLRKEAKQALAAEFQAKSSGNTLEISNIGVDGFLGQAKLSGKLINPFDPKIQLKLELAQLNLSELRIALPEWREKIPKGSVSGQLTFSGTQDKEKPWSDWPLEVAGSLRATIPEYSVVSPPAVPSAPLPKNALPKSGAKPSDALLPAGRLTHGLKIKVAADIESFKKEKLVAKGIHSEGMIAGGHFRGLVSVKDIFSGGVDVSALDFPLDDPRPAISGQVKWHDLSVEDAIGFAKPEYREFASGKMAGQTEFMTYLPSDEEFLGFLKAKGEVTMRPVTLNSVKVGEMINGLAKQLPMVKIQPVKVDPLHGEVHAVFALQKQTLQVDSLEAKDVDTSELNLKGKVAIPAMQGDFAGTFFWAKPQVQGCLLEGNSDASGRMLIPVAIKGDLMHPGLDSLSDLISKLAGKALNCEQKKLVDKLKKDGGKQLENEVKKQLEGLFGH